MGAGQKKRMTDLPPAAPRNLHMTFATKPPAKPDTLDKSSIQLRKEGSQEKKGTAQILRSLRVTQPHTS